MGNRRSKAQEALGLMIASAQGRSGKTTVCIGIGASLKRRGLAIQAFKKGPDYIDPSWLSAATGRNCRNLDIFLMREEGARASFLQACRGVDFGLIEGAMGLYDGLYPSGRGSSAHLARLIHVPVILIVNTSRMTRSVAAMVTGYQHFEPETDIAGVILNSVSGKRHEHKLVGAIERYCGIPVLGLIPRDHDVHIAERHLGLIPFPESEEAEPIVERIGDKLEPHLDLDGILAVARRLGPPLRGRPTSVRKEIGHATIGVMRDRVFNFYYPENLEALSRAGAELVFINSLRDRLPEIDGLYIGGGFPEFFLEELEANRSLRRDIAEAVEEGLPVYAECAGLMYLCRGICWQGQRHQMVGVIPAEVEICQRPQGHGYVVAQVSGENPLFPIGLVIRGHEFHHSKLSLSDEPGYAYRIRRGRGIDGRVDGIVYKNVFAAYAHVHALGVPTWAEAFVSLASREGKPGLSAAMI
jgi:cobyrinic acid a,c-diamide synthase